MDKRTMGSFIAALRRSKGMTQRELAQLLHVSDKTVSRWETGESAPDLALIPAIAEIFGVTCDELLRGERKSGADAAESTPLGRETRHRLLSVSMSKLNVSIIISVGITLSGFFLGRLAGSLSGKYGAYEWTCVCTSLAALIYQIAALAAALSAASGAEPDGEIIAFRRSAVIRALASVCFPATVMPAAAFGALAHGFAWDVAMACIISFAFAVFACVLAYALMYSRDFFG